MAESGWTVPLLGLMCTLMPTWCYMYGPWAEFHSTCLEPAWGDWFK
jgi:hypothetical protein